MSSRIQCYSLILHLISFSLLELFAQGIDVRLLTSDVQVDVGDWAIFNCSVSCKFSETHTFKWFIGSSSRRQVNSVSDFYQRTGIQVQLKQLTSCGSNNGRLQLTALHQLRVNVTSESVELLNKTAVQCAALRKTETLSDLYSYYGVILVNSEPENPTASFTESIEPTRTVTTTSVVTVFQTVTVTNSPLPKQSQRILCNGTLKRAASVILTMFLITTILFILH